MHLSPCKSPYGVRKYCDKYVCVPLCLSLREDISGTTRAIFTKFLVRVAYGRGSIFLRRMGDVCYIRLPCFVLWLLTSDRLNYTAIKAVGKFFSRIFDVLLQIFVGAVRTGCVCRCKLVVIHRAQLESCMHQSSVQVNTHGRRFRRLCVRVQQ